MSSDTNCDLLTINSAGLVVQELTSGCSASAGRPRCGVPRVPGIPAAVPDCARAGRGDVRAAVGAAPCNSRGDTRQQLPDRGTIGCLHQFYETFNSQVSPCQFVLLPLLQMAQQPAVAHALQVREAVCMDDYAAFFKLYGAAPGMGRALLDMFVSVVRWRALNALVRVFKPSLGADFLARLLGFVARSSTAGNQSDAKAELQGEAAALEVLPGCSAAVFPGKYPAAVRLVSHLLATDATSQVF